MEAHTLRSRVVSGKSGHSSYRSRRNNDTLIVSHGDQHMMSQRASSMVFSHFRHMRSYRGDGAMYTCSSFLSSLGSTPKHLLVVGQENGSCSFLNMWTNESIMNLDAHTSSIDAVHVSCDQRLVLTNSADGVMKLWDSTRPTTGGLGSKPTGLKLFASFEECFNPKFSSRATKVVSSHIVHESSSMHVDIQIGQRYCTTVHDIETKAPLNVLEDVNGTTMYRSGSCCFDPLDQQVFCDGQLWDLKSNQMIHRFDRLGNEGNAVFHPRRSELIVDNAIWDLRMMGSSKGTSKLLKVVPALEDSMSLFSTCGDALYTYKMNQHNSNQISNQVVRVLDGWDYNDIGQPIELEDYYARSLCTDQHDDYIAITVDAQIRSESCVKLYEVGRRKPNEADSDMDDAQSESEAPDDDEEEDEFGFDALYYEVGHGDSFDDVEPDLMDLF